MTTTADAAGQILLYDVGGSGLEVQLQGESVWLNQAQLAELFQRDRSVIARHLRKIFAEEELEEAERVRTLPDPRSGRPTAFYGLEVIISLGYRVRSPRGVQFRKWASRTLREHLMRGYTLNERRLQDRGLGEMQEAMDLLTRTLNQPGMLTDEGRGVLDVVATYAQSWLMLLQYDEDRLPLPPARHPPVHHLDVARARMAITALKDELVRQGEATELFGRERSDQLEAILAAVEQTFGGEPLYPSAEERAAHLLYFIIKDHPFTDGNKRIGAFLFAVYLWENAPAIAGRLDNDALVAMALLTAESEARNKDLLIRLILNLLAAGQG